MNAIQEMLLQSHNRKIRIFPAMPDTWPDAAFENLRAEGAFLVSARRKAGRCVFAKIHSEKGGRVMVQCDFGEGQVNITAGEKKAVVRKIPATDLWYDFKTGETILLRPASAGSREFPKIEPVPGRKHERNFFGTKKTPRL